jgi:hypothetical protein
MSEAKIYVGIQVPSIPRVRRFLCASLLEPQSQGIRRVRLLQLDHGFHFHRLFQQDLNAANKLQIYKYIIRRTVTYGCETRAMTVTEQNRLLVLKEGHVEKYTDQHQTMMKHGG